MYKHSLIKTAMASFMLVALAGCPFDDDDDDITIEIEAPTAPTPTPTPTPDPMEYSYQIDVTNLTHAQPMSPVAVTLHADAKMWQIGEAASNSLEVLAESGSPVDFIGQSSVLASGSGDGILMPGTSATITVTTTDATATHLSIATMLVNTNDAFSGLTGVDLSSITVDNSRSWNLSTYDAGTEANTEAAGTIPGPADGGTGYSDVRDDTNVVTMHSGVVTADDGLSSSVLTQAHRFDNPTLRLTITRTK